MTNRDKQWELAVRACDRFPLLAQNLADALDRDASDEELLVHVRAINRASLRTLRNFF